MTDARYSFERSLAELLIDPLGRQSLARLDAAALRSLAEDVARRDPYGSVSALARAFEVVGVEPQVTEHLEHELWCASREARWELGLIDGGPSFADSVEIVGVEHLEALGDRPAVMLGPMTLSTHDAVQLVAAIHERVCPERDYIFYGDEMHTFLERYPRLAARFIDAQSSELRRVISTLRAGGSFVTYPDFVYAGHGVSKGQLFGRPRPFSSGFMGLAARPGTELLPFLVERIQSPAEGLRVTFYPATRYRPPEVELGVADRRALARATVQHVVGVVLENLIRQAPASWRLLATLTHESPQLADNDVS